MNERIEIEKYYKQKRKNNMSSPGEYLIDDMIKLGWEINNQGIMIKKVNGEIVGVEKDVEWYLDVEKCNKLQNSTLNNNEAYPKEWKHATIHLNPETGEIHSDGDDGFVRKWIIDRINSKKWKKISTEIIDNKETFNENSLTLKILRTEINALFDNYEHMRIVIEGIPNNTTKNNMNNIQFEELIKILKDIKSYVKPINIKLPPQDNIPIINAVLTDAGKKFLEK
jgi:hypothetical protein